MALLAILIILDIDIQIFGLRALPLSDHKPQISRLGRTLWQIKIVPKVSP